MTVTVLEDGAGWLNAEVTMPDVDSNAYVLGPVRAIVDGGTLGLYTSTDAEVQFLAKNTVSTVFSPLLNPGAVGYNGGNRLIGL